MTATRLPLGVEHRRVGHIDGKAGAVPAPDQASEQGAPPPGGLLFGTVRSRLGSKVKPAQPVLFDALDARARHVAGVGARERAAPVLLELKCVGLVSPQRA